MEEDLLAKPCSGSSNEGNIIDRFGWDPRAGIVKPDFKAISGVNHVVARALDTVTRRREYGDRASLIPRPETQIRTGEKIQKEW